VPTHLGVHAEVKIGVKVVLVQALSSKSTSIQVVVLFTDVTHFQLRGVIQLAPCEILRMIAPYGYSP
jgi:hypothetical protein